MCFYIYFAPGDFQSERCNVKYFIHGYVYSDRGTIFQRYYLILTSENILEWTFMVTTNNKGRKTVER